MADSHKFNGGPVFSDFKFHFRIFRTKRTVTIAYGFVFFFIAFTIFLAFSPSSNSAAPWFTNVFDSSAVSGRSPASSVSSWSQDSLRSRFPSVFSYLFPNSSVPLEYSNSSLTDSAGSQRTPSLPANMNTLPSPAINETRNGEENHSSAQNATFPSELSKGSPNLKNLTQTDQLNKESKARKQNQTRTEGFVVKVDALQSNQSAAENKTITPSPISGSNLTQKGISQKGLIKNFTSSLMKKPNNGSTNTANLNPAMDILVKSLKNCNLFDGNWVQDDSYPLYNPGSCSLIDEQFNCFLNGRPDNLYHKLKWQPKACSIPRLNGSHMLEMLRGKRLVFVGDSLNRNMWESLICILKNSVKDPRKVYEQSGRHHFRTEASYSFVFEDYKCTVELFVSPFIVQEGEIAVKNGTKKETLRLDVIGKSADNYKNADIIVFNTGHWWTHEKTSKGKDYYQEGSHVYEELDVNEAFRKALTTWGRWVDANINPRKSLVFFRGYSASHFSGGQWNSGGQCDNETDPIKNEKYLTPYPPKMTILEKIFRGMKSNVTYLNVTRMTDYRKDAHPSIYRKLHLTDTERRSPLSFQDCSHWCLPGVPDSWNEILYAELLVKLNQS